MRQEVFVRFAHGREFELPLVGHEAMAADQARRWLDDQFVANPNLDQMQSSSLDLIYVGNKKDMLMIEGSADRIFESTDRR